MITVGRGGERVGRAADWTAGVFTRRRVFARLCRGGDGDGGGGGRSRGRDCDDGPNERGAGAPPGHVGNALLLQLTQVVLDDLFTLCTKSLTSNVTVINRNGKRWWCLDHGYLLDAVGVLLHGDFLHRALETEEGFDVQAGRLLKTRPVLVLRVNLTNKHAPARTLLHTERSFGTQGRTAWP